MKFSKGRKAADEILSRFIDRAKVSISNKKFALACKFHEYIFEPCYSEINSIFYGIGFHRFIANILHLEFSSRGAGAEQIFEEFEELLRTKNESTLASIFASSAHPKNSPILIQIREFAMYRADDIRKELESLSQTGTGKWVLDLSSSALFTLLANWGAKHSAIKAICDQSKPLQQSQGLFNSMVNNPHPQQFSHMWGEQHPITFNLSEPLIFSDSKNTPGIQIADVIAAIAVYVFSREQSDFSQKWSNLIAPISANGSIIPDQDELRLETTRVQRNVLVLHELHSRAKHGKSLIDGMDQHIAKLTAKLASRSIQM